jgi:hypothetical protein
VLLDFSRTTGGLFNCERYIQAMSMTVKTA